MLGQLETDPRNKTIVGELLPATVPSRQRAVDQNPITALPAPPPVASSTSADPFAFDAEAGDEPARKTGYKARKTNRSLVIWCFVFVVLIGMCGGIGLVAISMSGSSKVAQSKARTRLSEAEARTKLRLVLDTWVKKGAIETAKTKFPGIEFDDPDLGPPHFVLLSYALGRSYEVLGDPSFSEAGSWKIYVEMTFRAKDGGPVNLLRVYEIQNPDERKVSRIFVETAEVGPRVRPD
jgi:hypothetical protein